MGEHYTGCIGVRKLRLLMTSEGLNHVLMDYKNARKKTFKLVIDSGARVNLIKARRLTPDIKFNSQNKIILHGLARNNPVETIGSCQISLDSCKGTIMTEFCICSSATSVPGMTAC